MDPWLYSRSPASIELMLRFARQRGVADGDLLAATRLSVADLKDPEMAIAADDELRIIGNLLGCLPEAADCGLEIGLSYQLSAYGLLGYGLMSSATGAAALALAQSFLPLTYTFARIAVTTDGRNTRMTFTAASQLSGSAARFVVERAMGATSRVLRDVIGSEARLLAFELARPHPERVGVQTVLGAVVRGGCSADSISFANALLHRPLPQANALTATMCERMCRELLQRRSPRIDTTAFVRAHLAGRPFRHPPLIAGIARLLNISERTLKRRLKEEGATFRQLSALARRDRANALIAEGRLSLAQIADDLGFSEPSAFSQAYKSWTGMRPTEARQRLGRDPPPAG